MGRKLLRRAKHVLCNHPGCRRVTDGRYCKEHSYTPPKRKTRDKFLDSPEWRAMSKAKLAETPWCELCELAGKTEPAIDVDHILPRHTYPQLALDPGNLQSLCLQCHCRKTRQGL